MTQEINHQLHRAQSPIGMGSIVTKMYCQGSNNHELKEHSLNDWLRAKAHPTGRSSEQNIHWLLHTGAFLRCFDLGLSKTTLRGWWEGSSTKGMVIMASTYWFIWYLQTTLLGMRPQVCVSPSMLQSWAVQSAAGPPKGYPARSRLSYGFLRESGGRIMRMSLSITVQALFILCSVIFSYDCCHLSWGFLRLLQ